MPLVDACLMLGFVTTGDGQLALTSDGRRFADADIQQSKQLFADVATERVPLVRTIRLALARADDGALKEAFFLDVLRRHYSADEARAQLDTAIDWGRYGELYEYAADTDQITADPAAGVRSHPRRCSHTSIPRAPVSALRHAALCVHIAVARGGRAGPTR